MEQVFEGNKNTVSSLFLVSRTASVTRTRPHEGEVKGWERRTE